MHGQECLQCDGSGSDGNLNSNAYLIMLVKSRSASNAYWGDKQRTCLVPTSIDCAIITDLVLHPSAYCTYNLVVF